MKLNKQYETERLIGNINGDKALTERINAEKFQL